MVRTGHTSTPSISTSPASGRSSPVTIPRVVVFPAPLGPTSPKKHPWGMSRSIPATARKALLARVPPAYGKVVADHVTLAAKVARDTPLPDALEARIIGQVDDGRGVQALVVQIGGTTDRPGGSTYHSTWSLGPGRRAVQSNDALGACEWAMFDEPLPLPLEPARF